MADAYTQERLAWLEAVQDDERVSPAAFTVAFAIQRGFGREGFAESGELVSWQSRAKLAAHTGQGERQITAHLRTLRDCGFLEIKRRFNGSSLYRKTMPNERKVAEYKRREIAEYDARKTAAPLRGKSPIKTGGKLPPNPLTLNPLNEPSGGEHPRGDLFGAIAGAAEAKSRRRASRPLPESWTPPDDAYEFGARLGLTSQRVELETAKFRNHATANDRRQVDWTASWRNWLLRTDSGQRRQQYAPRQSASDMAAEVLEIFE